MVFHKSQVIHLGRMDGPGKFRLEVDLESLSPENRRIVESFYNSDKTPKLGSYRETSHPL
jgi:hypothetical protein